MTSNFASPWDMQSQNVLHFKMKYFNYRTADYADECDMILPLSK